MTNPYECASRAEPCPPLAASSTHLTRQRPFVLFWSARTFTNGAYMMQAVAVGWQIYDLTNDPLDLGLVGLVQFFPLIAMSIVAGQLLDLFDRRAIACLCQAGKALAALALAIGSARGSLSRDAMLAILFLSGTARAFEVPTMHALLPGVVPATLLPRAIAASATAQQTAVICGPALGGLIYALGPAVVYADLHAHLRRRRRADGAVTPERRRESERAAAPAGHARDLVRGLSLHPQQSDRARRHLARLVRGAAGRGDCAAADLCARHSRGRTMGARAAAHRAGGGRARRRAGAGAARDRGARRTHYVRRGRGLRAGDHSVRAVDLARALVPRAHPLRRRRCGERR